MYSSQLRALVLAPHCQTAVIEVNLVDCWELDLKEDRVKLHAGGTKSTHSGASLAWCL